MGEYVSKAERSAQAEFADPNAWVASLAPSYLRYARTSYARCFRPTP